jgi:hypothetical protein
MRGPSLATQRNERKEDRMKLIWAKKGILKLGPNNFIRLEVGDEIPAEVLTVLGNAVPQLVKDGQFRDVSEEVAEQAERLKDAADKAKKAMGAKK